MTPAPNFVSVFVDATGKYGDVVPVVVDEGKIIPDAERLALTIKLGAPETVFINNVTTANISFIHLQGEVDFAGTPALAAAWLLSKLHHKPIIALQGRAGSITVSQENGLTWVCANLTTMPPWNHRQVASTEEVECHTLEQTKTWEHTMVWAWIDEAKGIIRARTFAPDWDIPEAQGNGSGSMMLATQLQRAIEVKHGDGSVIFAKPAQDGYADIGGRIIEEKV